MQSSGMPAVSPEWEDSPWVTAKDALFQRAQRRAEAAVQRGPWYRGGQSGNVGLCTGLSHHNSVTFSEFDV